LLRGVPGNIFTYLGTKGLLKPFKKKHSEIRYIENRRDYNRYLLENTDVVVTHTRFLENKLYEYGIHPREVFFFPNGIEIDASAPPPQKESREEGKLVIGYMGQVAVHKGVDVLVKAYRLLDPKPGQAELRIYGELKSWPDYVNELRRLAGDRPDILFAGPYPAQEADRVMDECDVIVVPSVWFENRPTVILEAFSRGKPVITSDLGGMTEQVRHGVDGFLFKPRDPHSLADQLRKLVDDPGLVRKLSDGIGKVMNVTDETNELEKLYQRLIEVKKQPQGTPS
jgi:glycosyltransferase involved in cell wall biosynthesis